MDKLVRKKLKLNARRRVENISKTFPFNNSIILKILFELGSFCPYKFSSEDLKNLRMTSTKVNDISKNLQTKVFALDYNSTNNYNSILDDALDETRSAHSTSNIELNVYLSHDQIRNQEAASKYKRILQLHGQSVRNLVIASGLDDYVDKCKEFGLNITSQLTSLNSITIYFSDFSEQSKFQQLKDSLPIPNLLKSIHIESVFKYETQGFELYSNDLPKELFKLFPSITTLYYALKIELNPVNAKEFLNRDSRIKFVKTNCPTERIFFDFVEFMQENPAHMSLFETLIEQISKFATNVSVTTEVKETQIFQSYLLKYKWIRLQECKLVKIQEPYDLEETVEGIEFQSEYCDCDMDGINNDPRKIFPRSTDKFPCMGKW